MQGIGIRIGRIKRSCLKKYVQIRNSYPKYLPSESPENPAKHTADQSVINLHSRSKFNGKLRVSGPAVCWRYDSECSKRCLSEPIDTSEYNHDKNLGQRSPISLALAQTVHLFSPTNTPSQLWLLECFQFPWKMVLTTVAFSRL